MFKFSHELKTDWKLISDGESCYPCRLFACGHTIFVSGFSIFFKFRMIHVFSISIHVCFSVSLVYVYDNLDSVRSTDEAVMEGSMKR